MNRAWIPAGALAGVSVAGLLALAPLTDSLGTQVEFPTSVAVSTKVSTPQKVSVPVSVNLKTVGSVKTAAFKTTRGGEARVDTSSDAGQVAVHVRVTNQPTRTETKQAPTEQDIKPKKPTPPRRTEIGTAGESNGDQGFVGGNDGSTVVGEQSGTPGG
jgi:hypothetical protein